MRQRKLISCRKFMCDMLTSQTNMSDSFFFSSTATDWTILRNNIDFSVPCNQYFKTIFGVRIDSQYHFGYNVLYNFNQQKWKTPFSLVFFFCENENALSNLLFRFSNIPADFHSRNEKQNKDCKETIKTLLKLASLLFTQEMPKSWLSWNKVFFFNLLFKRHGKFFCNKWAHEKTWHKNFLIPKVTDFIKNSSKFHDNSDSTANPLLSHCTEVKLVVLPIKSKIRKTKSFSFFV